MPDHYEMKNKNLATSAKYGTPMQKNYGGPKMYNSPADMHGPHKMGHSGAPGKFNPELNAAVDSGKIKGKFADAIKNAGSKDKS